MGPQAASELEPAGAWKGFCLPGAAGCWEGSATASSARGGQQLVAAGLEPACPAWAASAPLGWEWPRGRMASPWQDGIPMAGCAVTMGGILSPGPMFVGENFIGIAEVCCVQAVVCQCQEKTGTVALLGAVSAHWCGAGMLVSWKSWITVPGTLWRWGRGPQPGF